MRLQEEAIVEGEANWISLTLFDGTSIVNSFFLMIFGWDANFVRVR